MTSENKMPRLRSCAFTDLSSFCHAISYRLSGAKGEGEDAEALKAHGWQVLDEAVAKHYGRPSRKTQETLQKEERRKKNMARMHAAAAVAKANGANKGGRPRKVKP